MDDMDQNRQWVMFWELRYGDIISSSRLHEFVVCVWRSQSPGLVPGGYFEGLAIL